MKKRTFFVLFMVTMLLFSLATNVSAAHTHTYDYVPFGSDTRHVKLCLTCDDVLEFESHSPRYDCLSPCSYCGHEYSSPTEHSYDTWVSVFNGYGNEQHHKICSVYWYMGRCGAVEPGSLISCSPVGTTWITTVVQNGYHAEFKSCAYCDVGVFQGWVSCFKALGTSTCMYCEGAGLN